MALGGRGGELGTRLPILTLGGALFVALQLLSTPWIAGMPTAAAVALAAGLVIGAQRGGGAYLRHYATRSLLVREGLVPRDLVAFLDHAARLVLLRRRGGGYQFIHGFMLEYFAASR